MTAKSLEESVIGNGRFPEKILQKLDIFANFYIGSHIELEGTGFHLFRLSVLSYCLELKVGRSKIPSLLTKGNQMKVIVKVLRNESLYLADGSVIREPESVIELESHFVDGATTPMMSRKGYGSAFPEPATWENDLFDLIGVWECEINEGTEEEIRDILKDMWMTYGNSYEGTKPEGYKGRSLAVGDVVIVSETAHTVRSCGWEAISGIKAENINEARV